MTGALTRLGPEASGPALVCLPYAGGLSDAYRRWVPVLPAQMELWGADLPGRLRRPAERPTRDLDRVLRDLASAVAPLLDRGTILFGHSMGALLAFELTWYLLDRGLPPPRLLVASGCAAPQTWGRHPPLAELSDAELTRRLLSWGGTPPELLADRSLLPLVLPSLRVDLQLCDGYRYRPRPPLGVPVLGCAGSGDPEGTVPLVTEWSALTSDWRGVRIWPGGHFYLHQAYPEVIGEILAATRPARSGCR